MFPLILNIVLFQAGWFASVLGPPRGLPWTGPAVVLLVVAVHLALSGDRKRELMLIGTATGIGLLAETGMNAAEFYSAAPWILPPPLAPAWLPLMWANFATTLNVSLKAISGRPFLSSLLGAVAGPLAYLGGARLGAIHFPEPSWHGLLALGVLWAVAVPALFALSRRFSRGHVFPKR
ncbi:MAG TPA: DUF2878 domain-containing protein [Candidatus Limnocylindria bacterium]|nr:DUF2878 domain-containing protein [Candidatus Limnocylindria bacterium]